MTNLNLKDIQNIDYSEIDYDRYAGYKKFATSKSVLYKSNNFVTENNTDSEAVVSPILNLSMSNGLLSYYIFDIEKNTIIEVTTYPTHDDISIGVRTFDIERDNDKLPHSWIAFEIMQILSRNNKLSDEAVIYAKNFMNTYLDINPTVLDKYTTKFDFNILKGKKDEN